MEVGRTEKGFVISKDGVELKLTLDETQKLLTDLADLAEKAASE